MDKFSYLGSVVSKDGGADEDIKSRISKARHVFRTLTPIWRPSTLSLLNKIRIFNTNVKSVMLWLGNVAHNKDQQKQITNDRPPVPAQHPEHQVARNHLKQRTLGKGQNKAQLKKASRRGNGGGLATRCANLHQTLPDRHWTGIPKEREKLVGPGRLGEEARTLK